jgi:hypothetical protein
MRSNPRLLLLRQKWPEVNRREIRCLARPDLAQEMWHPADINDLDQTLAELNALDPVVHYVGRSNGVEWDRWRRIRVFQSAAPFEGMTGRALRFHVRDRRSGLSLGIIGIASDLPKMGSRDTYIGWSPAHRHKRLRNTAVASTIVPTQPFGFNFLGAKCVIACLLADEVVQRTWQTAYGDILVGITTTSLFGSGNTGTQYDDTDFVRLGVTKGTMLLKPDKRLWRRVREELKTLPEYAGIEDSHTASGPATGIKQRELEVMLRGWGVRPSDYRDGQERGEYFATFYENTPEFLRGTIAEADLRPRRFKKSTLAYWRTRAEKRYRTLHAQGRLKTDVKLYHDLIGLDWDAARRWDAEP